jgi:hypothetical protein
MVSSREVWFRTVISKSSQLPSRRLVTLFSQGKRTKSKDIGERGVNAEALDTIIGTFHRALNGGMRLVCTNIPLCPGLLSKRVSSKHHSAKTKGNLSKMDRHIEAHAQCKIFLLLKPL